MAHTARAAASSLRIDADDLKKRMAAGEAATILDARNPSAWASSQVKLPGAVHVDAGQMSVPPEWPRERLTVVY